MNGFKIFFSFILIFTSMCVTAQYKELLKEVDEDRIKKISDYNSHFLGDAAYFAKRYRIVEVNSDLFFGDEAFSITPFEDISVVVARDSLKERAGSATWHGTIIDPYVSMSDLEVSEEQLAQEGTSKISVYKALLGLRFGLMDWDSDGQTGNAYPSYENKGLQTSRRPVEVPDLQTFKKHAFRSVIGLTNLDVFQLGQYMLVPLQFTPKYHLIYEMDPQKRFFVPEDDTDQSFHAKEQREKSRAFDDYKKTLPKYERKVVKEDIK